jgi:nucleotide-binding universal stress UspA family protein
MNIMSEYKTILLATDFSDGSDRACRHARNLAQLAGARLHVLHVIAELADRRRRQLPAGVIDTFAREVTVQAIEDMRLFCEKHFADLPITHDVVLGGAAEEIVRQAQTLGADLIVMGTHSRTGLEHLFVGSTAERVVRESPIPVLTVRA